jgi:hypothetical protein
LFKQVNVRSQNKLLGVDYALNSRKQLMAQRLMLRPQIQKRNLHLATAIAFGWMKKVGDAQLPSPFLLVEKANSLSNAIRPGRYHHPSRAARLGTPVRSRFCIERRPRLRSNHPFSFTLSSFDTAPGSFNA